MNYERFIAYDFPKSGLVPLFSGSSLNRTHNEKKKVERRKKEAKTLSKDVYQHEQNRILFSNAVGELCDKRTESIRKKKFNKRREEYTLSRNSGRKIRNKCAAFFSASAKAFVTLTFLSDLEDKKALDCLKQMLHAWRKEFGKNFNYIWVAERQKNGRIHFHVMTSEKMNIPKQNARWVRIQYNAGLRYYSKKLGRKIERDDIEKFINNGIVVDAMKDKKNKDRQIIYTSSFEAAKQMCALYNTSISQHKYIAEMELQQHLNCFDIEYINSQSHLSYYLTKYVTKTANNEDKSVFKFLPWGCSHRVSKTMTEQIVIPELFLDAMTKRNSVTVEKEFVRKSTGEIVAPGTVINANVHKNDWSISVTILNRPYYHSWFWDMKQINKKILNEGYCPEIIDYDNECYYQDYVKTYTAGELDLLNRIIDTSMHVDLNGNLIFMNATEIVEMENLLTPK